MSTQSSTDGEAQAALLVLSGFYWRLIPDTDDPCPFEAFEWQYTDGKTVHYTIHEAFWDDEYYYDAQWFGCFPRTFLALEEAQAACEHHLLFGKWLTPL